MKNITARKLNNLINSNIDDLTIQSDALKCSLVELSNVGKDNRLYTLELKESELLLKSDPLKFYPLYEDRLVIDGVHSLWKGEFYFINEEKKRVSLVAFYVSEPGYVSVNNTQEWNCEVNSTEAFRIIFDQLFISAIEHNLITA